MSIDALEEAVNEVSDTNWTWWPFLWLRPQKNQHLGLLRSFAIAILYGLPCSAVTALGLSFASVRAQAFMPFAMLGYPLAFLFLASVIVGPMWNRRADRVRKQEKASFGVKTSA